MNPRNLAFLAVASAAAVLALGVFLWLGATPRVCGLVAEARPLGGDGQGGLLLRFSVEEERFQQRANASGGQLNLTLHALDARVETTLDVDALGHATLLFPFALERARRNFLSVHLTATWDFNGSRTPLPPGDLRLAPLAHETSEVPTLELVRAGRTGPRRLRGHALQWPPPVEQYFFVDWDVDGADGAACTLQATNNEGVLVEVYPSISPGYVRTRIFAPPLVRGLFVTLRERDGTESTWRGDLPEPPANIVLDARTMGPALLVHARSNLPEAQFDLELVDEVGVLANERLVVTPSPDGYGAGDVRFANGASPKPQWLLVREAGGSDAKVIFPVVSAADLGALHEGRRRPNLSRWRAFDDFPQAVKHAKQKRRRAMAVAFLASLVVSLVTLGRLGLGGSQKRDRELTIDGSASVVDPTRKRPLLVLLVLVLFAMAGVAASLSDLW